MRAALAAHVAVGSRGRAGCTCIFWRFRCFEDTWSAGWQHMYMLKVFVSLEDSLAAHVHIGDYASFEGNSSHSVGFLPGVMRSRVGDRLPGSGQDA